MRPKFKPGQDYYQFCERLLHYYCDSAIAQLNAVPPGKIQIPRNHCSWRLYRKINKRLSENEEYKLSDWYGYESCEYVHVQKDKICRWKVREKRRAERVNYPPPLGGGLLAS